jgi:hypothetical protein
VADILNKPNLFFFKTGYFFVSYMTEKEHFILEETDWLVDLELAILSNLLMVSVGFRG